MIIGIFPAEDSTTHFQFLSVILLGPIFNGEIMDFLASVP